MIREEKNKRRKLRRDAVNYLSNAILRTIFNMPIGLRNVLTVNCFKVSCELVQDVFEDYQKELLKSQSEGVV